MLCPIVSYPSPPKHSLPQTYQIPGARLRAYSSRAPSLGGGGLTWGFARFWFQLRRIRYIQMRLLLLLVLSNVPHATLTKKHSNCCNTKQHSHLMSQPTTTMCITVCIRPCTRMRHPKQRLTCKETRRLLQVSSRDSSPVKKCLHVQLRACYQGTS